MTDQKDYNRRLVEEFRANQGGGPMAGRPLLVLTTTGAKTGQPRTTPMMFVRVDGSLLVIASNAGAPAHPDWYRNLVAHPDVTAEVGAETFAAHAVVLEGAQRERAWVEIVKQYPFFSEHQAKIARRIPLIALEQIDDEQATSGQSS